MGHGVVEQSVEDGVHAGLDLLHAGRVELAPAKQFAGTGGRSSARAGRRPAQSKSQADARKSVRPPAEAGDTATQPRRPRSHAPRGNGKSGRSASLGKLYTGHLLRPRGRGASRAMGSHAKRGNKCGYGKLPGRLLKGGIIPIVQLIRTMQRFPPTAYLSPNRIRLWPGLAAGAQPKMGNFRGECRPIRPTRPVLIPAPPAAGR